MSAPAPDPTAPPSTPLQVALRWVLLLAVLGAFFGTIYWKRSRVQRGGAITFGQPVAGTLDVGTDLRAVPGRAHEMLDRADVWRIDLHAGEPVTVHACASSRSSIAQPRFLVQGPSDEAPVADASQVIHVSPNHDALVVRPNATGQHAIWMFKPRNGTPYAYRLEVLRGEVRAPSGDLCVGAYP